MAFRIVAGLVLLAQAVQCTNERLCIQRSQAQWQQTPQTVDGSEWVKVPERNNACPASECGLDYTSAAWKWTPGPNECIAWCKSLETTIYDTEPNSRFYDGFNDFGTIERTCQFVEVEDNGWCTAYLRGRPNFYGPNGDLQADHRRSGGGSLHSECLRLGDDVYMPRFHYQIVAGKLVPLGASDHRSNLFDVLRNSDTKEKFTRAASGEGPTTFETNRVAAWWAREGVNPLEHDTRWVFWDNCGPESDHRSKSGPGKDLHFTVRVDNDAKWDAEELYQRAFKPLADMFWHSPKRNGDVMDDRLWCWFYAGPVWWTRGYETQTTKDMLVMPQWVKVNVFDLLGVTDGTEDLSVDFQLVATDKYQGVIEQRDWTCDARTIWSFGGGPAHMLFKTVVGFGAPAWASAISIGLSLACTLRTQEAGRAAAQPSSLLDNAADFCDPWVNSSEPYPNATVWSSELEPWCQRTVWQPTSWFEGMNSTDLQPFFSTDCETFASRPVSWLRNNSISSNFLEAHGACTQIKSIINKLDSMGQGELPQPAPGDSPDDSTGGVAAGGMIAAGAAIAGAVAAVGVAVVVKVMRRRSTQDADKVATSCNPLHSA